MIDFERTEITISESEMEKINYLLNSLSEVSGVKTIELILKIAQEEGILNVLPVEDGADISHPIIPSYDNPLSLIMHKIIQEKTVRYVQTGPLMYIIDGENKIITLEEADISVHPGVLEELSRSFTWLVNHLGCSGRFSDSIKSTFKEYGIKSEWINIE